MRKGSYSEELVRIKMWMMNISSAMLRMPM